MGKRRRARELAVQYLFQWDFHGPAEEEPARNFWDARSESQEIKNFAHSLVMGVKDNCADIDKLIEANSRNWKLYRMSRIDRNILRMAVYEFVYVDDTPPKVAIDEAIEIGKKFGTEESGKFINGILDQIGRKLGKISQRETGKKGAKTDDTPGDGPPG